MKVNQTTINLLQKLLTAVCLL